VRPRPKSSTPSAAHLEAVRELTRRKASGHPGVTLVADYALFHMEADLRWIELGGARLERLTKKIRR
jgi:hypothetical protein